MKKFLLKLNQIKNLRKKLTILLFKNFEIIFSVQQTDYLKKSLIFNPNWKYWKFWKQNKLLDIYWKKIILKFWLILNINFSIKWWIGMTWEAFKMRFNFQICRKGCNFSNDWRNVQWFLPRHESYKCIHWNCIQITAYYRRQRPFS